MQRRLLAWLLLPLLQHEGARAHTIITRAGRRQVVAMPIALGIATLVPGAGEATTEARVATIGTREAKMERMAQKVALPTAKAIRQR